MLSSVKTKIKHVSDIRGEDKASKRKRQHEGTDENEVVCTSPLKKIRGDTEEVKSHVRILGDWVGWMKEKAYPILNRFTWGNKTSGSTIPEPNMEVKTLPQSVRAKERKKPAFAIVPANPLQMQKFRPIKNTFKDEPQLKRGPLRTLPRDDNFETATELLESNRAKGAIAKKEMKKFGHHSKNLLARTPAFLEKAIQKCRRTPNETIRLDEKECYRLLLEQHQRLTNQGFNATGSLPSPSQGTIMGGTKSKPAHFTKVQLSEPVQRAKLNQMIHPAKLNQTKHQQKIPFPSQYVLHHWDKNIQASKAFMEPQRRKSLVVLSEDEDVDTDEEPLFLEQFVKNKGNSFFELQNKKVSSSTLRDNAKEVKIIEKTRDSQSSPPEFMRRKSLPEHREVPFTQQWVEELCISVESDVRFNKLKIEDERKKKEALSDAREARFVASNKKLFDDIRQREVIISDDSEDEDYLPLPEITPKMQSVIDGALRTNPQDEILIKAFGLQITRRDMETLAGLNWLNDEIINFYTNMLSERGKLDNYPSCFAFNSFFYPKLMGQGHVALKRWTRKFDIFSYDFILIPVHLGLHWCLAVIDFRQKKIQYYDSMLGHNPECLNALRTYLQDESLDKRKKEYDMSDWKLEAVKNIPQQMNGCDCGMFALKYAEYITRNAKITFTQQNMPYFRRRMVFEILTNKLL